MTTPDVELTAMSSIWNALQTLPDDEGRARCIKWAIARLGLNVGTVGAGPNARAAGGRALPAMGKASANGESLDDIVEHTEDGRLRVIARDLKAKSKNDAAI